VIFSAFSAKIFGGVAALALLGAGVNHFVMSSRLQGERNHVAQLQARVAALYGERQAQNAQVDAWRTVADERQRLSTQMLDAARANTTRHVERVERIMEAPTPPPDQECEAAMDLLRQFQ
jgi:ferritin-like metal-binding protein YciE